MKRPSTLHDFLDQMNGKELRFLIEDAFREGHLSTRSKIMKMHLQSVGVSVKSESTDGMIELPHGFDTAVIIEPKFATQGMRQILLPSSMAYSKEVTKALGKDEKITSIVKRAETIPTTYLAINRPFKTEAKEVPKPVVPERELTALERAMVGQVKEMPVSHSYEGYNSYGETVYPAYESYAGRGNITVFGRGHPPYGRKMTMEEYQEFFGAEREDERKLQHHVVAHSHD